MGKHIKKWDRCFNKLKKEKGDSGAAAICSSSIKNAGLKAKEQKRDKKDYYANKKKQTNESYKDVIKNYSKETTRINNRGKNKKKYKVSLGQSVVNTYPKNTYYRCVGIYPKVILLNTHNNMYQILSDNEADKLSPNNSINVFTKERFDFIDSSIHFKYNEISEEQLELIEKIIEEYDIMGKEHPNMMLLTQKTTQLLLDFLRKNTDNRTNEDAFSSNATYPGPNLTNSISSHMVGSGSDGILSVTRTEIEGGQDQPTASEYPRKYKPTVSKIVSRESKRRLSALKKMHKLNKISTNGLKKPKQEKIKKFNDFNN